MLHNFTFTKASMRLANMLICCGHEIVTDHNYNWHGLKRGKSNFILWKYTIAGEGEVVLDNKIHKMKKGDSMLLHIPGNHEYYLSPNSKNWEFLFVIINGKDAIRICRDIERLHGAFFKISSNSNAVNKLKELIENVDKIDNVYMASSIAYSIIMSIAESVAMQNIKKIIPSRIQKVIDECNCRLENPLTVEEMALIANTSKWHFQRIFKETMGLAPAHYMRNLQLKYAVDLLAKGNYTIKEIAIKCGFNSTTDFNRVFKKSYGFTPGEFKKTI